MRAFSVPTNRYFQGANFVIRYRKCGAAGKTRATTAAIQRTHLDAMADRWAEREKLVPDWERGLYRAGMEVRGGGRIGVAAKSGAVEDAEACSYGEKAAAEAMVVGQGTGAEAATCAAAGGDKGCSTDLIAPIFFYYPLLISV